MSQATYYDADAAIKELDALQGIVSEDTISRLRSMNQQFLNKCAEVGRLMQERDLARKELADLKDALTMYEFNAGEHAIMFRQNLNLCLDQVKQGKK